MRAERKLADRRPEQLQATEIFAPPRPGAARFLRTGHARHRINLTHEQFRTRPPFLPQILKVRATRDAAGVSWSWAALTTINNAAWIAYFALFRYWIALVPACSVTLLAGALTVMLTSRGEAKPRSAAAIGAWAAALAALWTAYRTARPSGISAGTWTLILGELACFLVYGLGESDPRLIALGSTGVTASTLMLARIFWTGQAADRRDGKDDEGTEGGPSGATTNAAATNSQTCGCPKKTAAARVPCAAHRATSAAGMSGGAIYRRYLPFGIMICSRTFLRSSLPVSV
jgi:hypothetical protein